MRRTLLVDLLVVLFGIGTWVCINGLWVELPLLVASQPEQWKLPSFMSVVIQLANIGPLSYSILHSLFPKYVREKPVIYLTMSIGVASTVLLAFFWNRTSFLFGQERSTALLSLVFCLALVDCSSRVLFLPFMAKFKEIYLTSFFIGEGLSGFVPSVVALVQGVGGNPDCRNQTESIFNETLNQTDQVTTLEAVYSDPLFSVDVFFYCLCAIMTVSALAFYLLNYHSIVKDSLVENTNCDILQGPFQPQPQIQSPQLVLLGRDNNQQPVPSYQSTSPSPVGFGGLGGFHDREGHRGQSEPITTGSSSEDSSSEDSGSLASVRIMGVRPRNPKLAPASRNMKGPGNGTGSRNGMGSGNGLSSGFGSGSGPGTGTGTEDELEPDVKDTFLTRISKPMLLYLLGVQLVVCALSNGVFPSIQSYSCLPYGNIAYHWAVTLSSMANPAVCFLVFYIPPPTKVSVSSVAVVGFGVGAFVLTTAAMSPAPPLVSSAEGEILLVLSWILLVAFFTYVKVSVALILRSEGKRGLFWCGAVTQFGSALGAIVTFFIVNYTQVFVGYQPCQQ